MDESINSSHKQDSDRLNTSFSLAEAENLLIKLNAKIKRDKTRRFQLLLIGVLIAILGFLVLITPNYFNVGFYYYHQTTITLIAIISIDIFVTFLIVIIFQSRIASSEALFEELRARQRVASQLDEGKSFHVYVGDGDNVNVMPSIESSSSSSPNSSSYFFKKLVDMNLQNLAAYYVQVKAQTDKSFNASLVAGAAGFILIGVGLAFGFTSTANSQILVYISSGSGVITEFIAAVFFYLYNQTVRQMKGYHDSLLNVQNILLSLKLVEDTKEEGEKVKMIGQMIDYLVGKRIFTPVSTESEKK